MAVTSKWIAAFLVTSVVLNLLLIGFIIGKRGMPEAGGDPTRFYPRWVRTLPESRREALSPLLRSHMQQMRPPLRGLRSLHKDLRAAIAAEPFDADALRTTLADMRRQNGQVQLVSHSSFVDFVAKLTPAERLQLAEDVGRGKPRGANGFGPRGEHKPNETR